MCDGYSEKDKGSLEAVTLSWTECDHKQGQDRTRRGSIPSEGTLGPRPEV